MSGRKVRNHPNIRVSVKDGRKDWRFECPDIGCAQRRPDEARQEFCAYRSNDGICMHSGAVNEGWRALAALAKYRMDR